jgi:hypothetical protein
VPISKSALSAISKLSPVPSKLTEPQGDLSLNHLRGDPPTTPIGVSGRMEGFADAGINGVSKAYFWMVYAR